MEVQSVLFPKKKYNVKFAKDWLKGHDLNLKFKEPDITKNYIRMRQKEPNKKLTRSIKTPSGIIFVV